MFLHDVYGDGGVDLAGKVDCSIGRDPRREGAGGVKMEIIEFKLILLEAINNVRSHYPEKVFPPDGESIECKSAFMARLTCDNIQREVYDRLKEIEGETPGGAEGR